MPQSIINLGLEICLQHKAVVLCHRRGGTVPSPPALLAPNGGAFFPAPKAPVLSLGFFACDDSDAAVRIADVAADFSDFPDLADFPASDLPDLDRAVDLPASDFEGIVRLIMIY